MLPGSCIKEKFFEDTRGGIFWPIFFISYVGGVYLIDWALKSKKKYQVRRARCIHGIKGGQTQNLCSVCIEEENKREEKFRQEERRLEKQKQFRKAADDLQKQERQRIGQLRTHNIEFLLSQSPTGFEDIVAQMYRALGYEAKLTSMSSDEGRDIILKRDGKKYLVECKRYQLDKLIGRPALQKFYAAIATDKAEQGFFVTTSNFSKPAVGFARKTNIILINGHSLAKLMSEAFPKSPDENMYRVFCTECGSIVIFNLHDNKVEQTCPYGHLVINDIAAKSLSHRDISDQPYCPKCGSRMRLIRWRGKEFYGCSRYPQCHGRRPCSK